MGEKTITQIADELGLSTTRTWTLIRKGYEQLRARFNEDIE
jgi:RNA polymerase sigma-70 factor (ECF subfamily)